MTDPNPQSRSFRRSRLEANGISILVRESGPPKAVEVILFLHGGTGAAARHWQPQLDRWAGRGYRCIAPDLRGHGGTTNDRDGLDQRLMAEDASRLLAACGVDRAHLVGFSIGGVIALYLALAHPDQVASITAIGSHMTVDEHVRRSNRTIEPDVIERSDPAHAQRLSLLHGEIYGPDHWRQLCRWLIETWDRQPDWRDDELAQVETPALIGRGAHDDRVVEQQIERMVEALPIARRFEIRGAGHFFHTTPGGAAALDAELRPFLSQRS